MTPRRIIKWLAGLGGLCLILLVAAALLLPRIVDSQAVKERIQALLLARTDGNVRVENIDLKWLPRPAVVARGASLSFANRVSGKIQSIEVYPSIMGLLRGQLYISRVEVASPALSVHLPEPGDEPFNIDELEANIRALIASIATEIPGMIVGVTGGSVEVRIGDRPPVMITELEGRLVAPPGEMQLQISSRANVFDSLRVDESIAADTLATKGSIKINRLRLRESLVSLFSRPDEYIEDGEVSLDVVLSSVGLKKIKAEFESTVPSLGLVRGDRKAVIEGITFKGVISRDEGIFSAVIQRLGLVSPRLSASGELTVDPSSSTLRLKLTGQDVDVSRVRDTALQITGDVEMVEDLFRYVKGGQAPNISLQAAGNSFANLWKNIEVAGTLRDGIIFAYVSGLDLNDVNGQFVVSRGILEAKQFSARSGKMQGSDGTLRLGLEGKNPPFHLDIMVQADAAELHSLLFRVLKDEGIRKELSSVRNIEGNLSGRLVLGDKIDSLSASVSIVKAALRGSYDRIPYPISIKEGQFQYGDDKIALKSVSGAVGLSSFSGLTGFLNYNGARHIEIGSGKFSFDLAQTRNLLNLFAALPKDLKDLDSAQGRLDLTSLSLKGPLDEPNQWDFTGAGTFGKIALKHTKLPAVMNLSGGTFNATPARLTVSNAQVNLLDASLTVDGSVESPYEAPPSLEAAAAGSIGAEMTGWLAGQVEMPKQFMLRSPLQVSQSRVLWKKDGDVAFAGDLRIAGGPQVSFDLVRGPETLEAKEILIVDGERRTHITVALKKDNVAFSFNGELEQATLNRIFQTPPLEGSLIQGDIQVSAFFNEAPLRFTARGRLAGRELRVPLKDETAIVEFFFLEADPNAVNIRSAKLRWRNSDISLMGKLLAEVKALRLDMDVSADQVVWEEISEIIDSEGHRGNNQRSPGFPLPPLEGTVRLKVDHFILAGFSSNPLQATASLSPQGIRGEIQRGDVCGIATVGKVDFTDEELGFDMSLSVKDGQLESTSSCLTENKLAISGSYSLQAHVAGRGPVEKVAQTLRGEFEFTAQDGQLVQSPDTDTPLEATFDYLNRTGNFDVAFPDLDRESFPFRSISSRGTLQGMTLVEDELIIQSSLMTIAGQGKIDLENNKIDARGLVSVRIPGAGLISRIPIFGSILDPSLLGIPVRVTGSLEQPAVSYLSPADVGAQLLNIPLRILGLPLEAIRLFTPNSREPKSK
jgi:AsmA-like C-terminal region/AsmA family